jgi:hypothetical protein
MQLYAGQSYNIPTVLWKTGTSLNEEVTRLLLSSGCSDFKSKLFMTTV